MGNTVSAKKEKPTLTQHQRALLSNSINLNLFVAIMERPSTVNDLVAELGLLPLEINYRLNQLTAGGLIAVGDREGPGGVLERYYESLLDDLSFITPASSDTRSNYNQVTLILNQLRKDLTYHALHPAPENPVHLMTIGIRARPEVVARFLEQLRAFEESFDAADDAAQADWYFLNVALYPQRPENAV